MIKTFYQEDIINRLAAIITYGLNEGYSYKTIEERIISSSLINALENNEYDEASKIDVLVESTYKVTLAKKEADISFKGLFIAESYFKLFLYFNKSFEYLFLYWPISNFTERYTVYHEMDFSNLREDFKTRIKDTTLLRKLAQDRHFKLTEISKLTGMSENTIDKYTRDDKYLYGASYSNIYKLSRLFNVKENIFISSLGIYLDHSIYLFDKRNIDYRNFLGFYFACYFDNRINEIDFNYIKDAHYFISKNDIRLIVVSDVLDNLSLDKLNKLVDKKTYMVIIPSGFFGDESHFNYLKDVNAYDVLMLTQEYVYIAKRKIKKDITDVVNKSLIIRATEASFYYN